MRILMKVTLPTDVANDRIRNGSLSTLIRDIMAEQQPEAAYFLTENGQRTIYSVVNMDDAAQIPAFGQPWYLAFDAQGDMHPVMSMEDFQKAGPAIARAAERYG